MFEGLKNFLFNFSGNILFSVDVMPQALHLALLTYKILKSKLKVFNLMKY